MTSRQPVTEREALRVIDLVYRAARSIADEARQAVAGGPDLDVGEFVLLRGIDAGVTSPGRLAQELHAHPAAISRSVSRLARAGLVERRPDVDDSRRTELRLTPAGRATVGAIARHVRPFVQARLADLSAQDLATTFAALAALSEDRSEAAPVAVRADG